jgi:hypothetical protein
MRVTSIKDIVQVLMVGEASLIPRIHPIQGVDVCLSRAIADVSTKEVNIDMINGYKQSESAEVVCEMSLDKSSGLSVFAEFSEFDRISAEGVQSLVPSITFLVLVFRNSTD